MEVREMPTEQRPRERLSSLGPEYLSDKELLSVLIGTGIKGKGVSALAEEVLKLLEISNYKTHFKTLKAVTGLGTARAALIAAALEFCRRIFCPEHHKISFPHHVLPIIRHYSDRKQEHFLCLSLNGAQEVIAKRIVSIGLLNRTVVHPREVFAGPIIDRAASIICAHNHPSGNVMPSHEDRDVTFMLKKAGNILGIKLLDHVIFSHEAYFSFQEQGEL
ncbi:MAG: DNA repair protein RadC [Spirochaetales bacterium]|nr:DNA repair protein RadC [Spirochaetales bacterium]